MSSAAQTRHRATVDLLNYATVIDSGIVLGKDGSMLAGFYYHATDQSALTNAERNTISARMNDKLRRLAGGWTLYVDAIRQPAVGYPAREEVFFPDAVTEMIDAERRGQYTASGHHFETAHAMVLQYLPPSLAQSKIEQMMYTDAVASSGESTIADKLLHDFSTWVLEFATSLTDLADIEIMGAYSAETTEGEALQRDSLVDYLSWCICGQRTPINLAAEIPFLDGVLGRHELVGGLEPIIDDQHFRVVAIDGFPAATHPNILSALDTLPLVYRWSSRFVYLDNETAKAEMRKFRRQWQQKQRGFIDQFTGKQSGAVDRDAVAMVDDTEAALATASSQETTFGFYTSVLILHSTDRAALAEHTRDVVTTIRNIGFGARVETLNSVEAWLGSLPGHPSANIRRPLMHTMNLADLLPMSKVWSGHQFNPCDKYPSGAPALIYADTVGATPFRLNLHVEDVGHTLIVGPTGTGKSTLLAMLATQFRKYRGAQVFAFDKGYSLFCLTHACGGAHYDIGSENAPLAFCPLAVSEPIWAETWLRDCCELQIGHPMTPEQKRQLHTTMQLVMQSGECSLSALHTQLQDQVLRDALLHYTVGGNTGHLLDAQDDALALSDFTCFELEELWGYSDQDKLPVLSYLFHRVERQLTGSPALLILDEAWMMLGHPVFREKIVEWLKVLRKANCAVVLATQSLSDASHSGILDVVLESTATKIFLPNPSANSEVSRPFYQSVGLNHAQIDLIARATPKRQYYATSSEGNRLFDLALGPHALAFTAQSGPAIRKQVTDMQRQYGDQWTHEWRKSPNNIH